jgi:tetratricopeptide (TPR) repeat protein
MDEALAQLLTLGRGCFQQKQYAEAEKYLAQFVEQNQGFADVYNMLGLIYHEQGQFARAQRSFESALRLNPGYTEAALNLAVIYNDLGKYKEAKDVYQTALQRQREAPGQMDPFVRGKIANMYAEIGDAYASAGLPKEAAVEYRRALELGPQFVDVRLKLGNTLRDMGDLDGAIAQFEEMSRINPNFLPGQVAYGIALLASGKRQEAIGVWEAVLAKDPQNRSAAMYLNLVRQQPSKVDRAV